MKKSMKLIAAMVLTAQFGVFLPTASFASEADPTIKTVKSIAEPTEESQTNNVPSPTDPIEENESDGEDESGESQEPAPEPPSEESGEEPPAPEPPKETEQPPTPDPQPEKPAPTPVPPGQPQTQQPSYVAPSVPIISSEEETEAKDGSIHFEKNETAESFIRKIGNSARKVGQENDLYASVIIAQALLESGNGSSSLSQAPYYNLFGIKGAYKGKSVSFSTQEDTGGGNMITINDGFRVYDSYQESLEDYAELIKEGIAGNPEFYSGAWKSNTESYEDATKFLTGKYATDTQYNQKLNGLIETYELTEYDKEGTDLDVNVSGYAIPMAQYDISSHFGPRGREFHRGIDMAAPQGEPIYASKEGTVKKAEYHSSWGNYVVIDHPDGYSTLYAHQSEYSVKAGEKVQQGDLIGFVGSTGNSTGPHLHLELSSSSDFSQSDLIDPYPVLFDE
ncbi:hypothetical protein NRIC_36060 [Enterococcus florum]|uniref:Mannosyl-glycoprotein endo-beta-N-acetylglucosamidase-like domain-containing protein n=1 Tax=Enterococcus florum TaxID=2480627 RepID=A0A4P5PBX6_9ENTE|nr:peptidoglycan DD-metalloendopeptidase family protein [Enterococcus florum]GCF95715.1 hypothetical protein NRIC_36060 [Enterococcus florum]